MGERTYWPLFEHWSVMEARLRDPDGHLITVQAPLPEGVEPGPGHRG